MTTLPRSASVAHREGTGAKLFAPSAARNTAPIVALLSEVAPPGGRALEIASGTGQHIVALAAAIPQTEWFPSDIAEDRLASIAAYAAEARLANLHPATRLDACTVGWADRLGPFGMIHVINLLHLIPTDAARTVISEAAQALLPGGRLVLYGPFLRSGQATSPGDLSFDAQLRASDPAIGYKDDIWIETCLQGAGLLLEDVRKMPSNNLAFIATKDQR
ncbi:DUF938 domain-containing protein [Sulfitobacter sp. HNIBRBA3233]|uniref:DUF938 domain-containing protein n=1 Tax=Sulfitobacter marinivivus TaxID=3158558 RepID=UPI0032DE4764